MPPKEKYTDPKLRDEVKEELKQSDKGGAPGQWSARKAQMMASEYKKRGGDYNTNEDQKDDSQKNLDKWGKEEWQTKEGDGKAKKEDGTQKRYLPKDAWKNMDEDEKEATDQKKQDASSEGKQFVENTEKAKEQRKKVSDENAEDDKSKNKSEPTSKSNGKDRKEAENDTNEGEEEYQDDHSGDENEDDSSDGDNEGPAKTGKKRKADKTSANESNKAAKTSSNSNAPQGTVGSKHMKDEEPAPRGSSDRLPKVGQKITWRAMPGFVDGEVTEVLTNGKHVDGKDVKANKDDPKIVMKSKSSGKICVHKPDACFYE